MICFLIPLAIRLNYSQIFQEEKKGSAEALIFQEEKKGSAEALIFQEEKKGSAEALIFCFSVNLEVHQDQHRIGNHILGAGL